MATAPDDLPQCCGNYELLEIIGKGGMAEVFRARARGAHGVRKDVAVKRQLPTAGFQEEYAKMVLDEARISTTLEHPNIVSVHEFCKVDGRYLLVMELVNGRSLAQVNQRIWSHGLAGLDLADVLFVGSEAAGALAYAHAKCDSTGQPLKVVHRDMSPQNILLSWDGVVKVADFGVAMATHRLHHTGLGFIKGKLAYMSPEQARGQEALGGQSDLFSLGIVLWETLARRRLFHDEKDDLKTVGNVHDMRVPPLSEIDPRIPRSVEAILARALARPLTERYQDAQALQEAFLARLSHV
ncbi:MAG: serine/threonine protein kinase [Deltaproteobacteria bacterium]|nr:serine/threonine protein kinase [Deltaproteobacteria bacterium]